MDIWYPSYAIIFAAVMFIINDRWKPGRNILVQDPETAQEIEAIDAELTRQSLRIHALRDRLTRFYRNQAESKGWNERGTV
ncbi:hypothetical protein HOY82DRAFT_610078 [Tuber indicum]|nr:hypothetical protein HOY82DRAFT_610078 [Tuber indicum]